MDLIVNEIFTSIQGEGVHTGIPTTFVRLAGCDLRCRWCDTPYALEKDSGKNMSTGEIMERINECGTSFVCITGGEPLLQREGLVDLARTLSNLGFNMDIETNGAHRIGEFKEITGQITMSVDVKMPSSGEYGSFHEDILEDMQREDQLKFIIDTEEDLEKAVELLVRLQPDCNIVMTPCSNSGGSWIVERMLGLLRQHEGDSNYDILRHARIMLQIHKVIWSEDMRGV